MNRRYVLNIGALQILGVACAGGEPHRVSKLKNVFSLSIASLIESCLIITQCPDDLLIEKKIRKMISDWLLSNVNMLKIIVNYDNGVLLISEGASRKGQAYMNATGLLNGVEFIIPRLTALNMDLDESMREIIQLLKSWDGN